MTEQVTCAKPHIIGLKFHISLVVWGIFSPRPGKRSLNIERPDVWVDQGMSYLFKPVYTHLRGDDREIMIELLASLGINAQGWQAAGVYQINIEGAQAGRMSFEGNSWRFDGTGLSEAEQEELAYFIRYYDGSAAGNTSGLAAGHYRN